MAGNCQKLCISDQNKEKHKLKNNNKGCMEIILFPCLADKSKAGKIEHV
jgi:hypothetical protein